MVTLWILIPKNRTAYMRIYRWLQENAIENKVKGKGVFVLEDTDMVRDYIRKLLALWGDVQVYMGAEYKLSEHVEA